MNLAELNKIANAMVAPGKGILAADESSGTIKKRFDAIKVESTEDNRRDYREMLFRSKEAMSKYISGVILYDETIWQKAKDGTPLVKLIEQAGAIPGIKVDEGTQPLPNCPGELITVGLDKLAERLKKYYEQGARFAKWRAVIDIGKGIPSYAAVHTNAHALARYAALCQQAQIVPIVEPEVLMDGDHGIDQCFEVTEFVLKETFQELYYQKVALRRHDPETQHGDLRQEGAKPRLRRRGRGENRPPAQELRAARGAGHRVPVRRAVRRGSHRASRRHEPDRRPAVEADLLLRPRAAGGAAEGVVGQGREHRRRPAGFYPSRADEFARQQGRVEGRPGTEKGGLSFMATKPAPPRPLPRLYLATPMVDDPSALVASLPALLEGCDIAAVLLRLKPVDHRSMISRIKAFAPAVQNGGAALLIEGNAELVARSGADGAHLTGIEAMQEALPTLKPDRIAGVGGLITRHDSMSAGEAGADYVLFGEPDANGQRPSADAIAERLQWWAELFEPPCVGFAATFDEASEFADAGADFVLVGDLIWADPRGAAAALMDASQAIRQSRAMTGTAQAPQG